MDYSQREINWLVENARAIERALPELHERLLRLKQRRAAVHASYDAVSLSYDQERAIVSATRDRLTALNTQLRQVPRFQQDSALAGQIAQTERELAMSERLLTHKRDQMQSIRQRLADARAQVVALAQRIVQDEQTLAAYNEQANRLRAARTLVGAPVELDRLSLATVGDGVQLSESGILRADTRESIGLGLFATRDFQQGEPITTYYGYTFRESVAPEDRLEHAIEGPGGWTIDGTRAADGTALVNPARQLAELRAGGGAYANDLDYARVAGLPAGSIILPANAVTNATFRRLMDTQTRARIERGDPIGKDEFAIFLEATQPIRAGDEIFVSYNLMAYATQKRTEGGSRRKGTPKRRPPGEQQLVGRCTRCTASAAKECADCGAPYCNAECQRADWPEHKFKCSAVKP